MLRRADVSQPQRQRCYVLMIEVRKVAEMRLHTKRAEASRGALSVRRTDRGASETYYQS